MADLGLTLAFGGLSAQSRAGGRLDQKWGFCDGIPNADSAPGLSGKFGSQTGSRDMSPPDTGRSTGNSTPSPPSMTGAYAAHLDPLSSGESTPPEQSRLQHLIESLECSKSRRLPLKPGLVDGPKVPAPWPLSLLPPPPGLPLPASALFAAPAPVPAAAAPPPSVGSIGHPDCCGEACKYVKRKTGCSQGADCPQCHLCFWRHRRVSNPEVDTICSTAFSAGVKCCPEDPPEEDLVRESLGSINHPDGCAAPCKYVKRKGGCRSGSSCPDCHLCHWRRTRTEAAPKPVGLSEETAPGFSRKSTVRLQNLIRLQLDTTTSTSTPPSGDLEPASPEPNSSGLTPSGADDDAPDNHFETSDDVSRLIGPAPGLDGPRFLSTQGTFLLGGLSAPR